jgi:hypothetical protein
MSATDKGCKMAALIFSFSVAASASPQTSPPGRVFWGWNSAAPLAPNISTCKEKTGTAGRADSKLPGQESLLADGLGSEKSAQRDAPCVAPGMAVTSLCRAEGGSADSSGAGFCFAAAGSAALAATPPDKDASKISQAREKVLEILRSPSACSEWFESRDARPAQTFETLTMEVDQRGPQEIFESSTNNGTMIVHQPYVASVIQGGGAYAAITINKGGAFYRSELRVLKVGADGGPYLFDGMRPLTVGSYVGDTLAARVVTLLHEFGHVIDLLPQDGDGLDGSSLRNTNEVLRHCRAEVDATRERVKLAKGTR